MYCYVCFVHLCVAAVVVVGVADAVVILIIVRVALWASYRACPSVRNIDEAGTLLIEKGACALKISIGFASKCVPETDIAPTSGEGAVLQNLTQRDKPDERAGINHILRLTMARGEALCGNCRPVSSKPRLDFCIPFPQGI